MSIVSSGQVTITDLSDGKDGVGIQNTDITYANSTSGTTAPTTGWTSSVPTLVKGWYLWTKTVWTYTDNSSETGYSVTYISKDGNNGTDGIAGKDGVGIKATAITYAKHTNGTVAPTTGYTTAVPSVPAGQFLWTKTVWTYTDNTSETGYSVAMMGVKGDKGEPGNNGTNGIAGKDGKGIKATAITYQASANGTTAPTGTWSASVPTVAKGSFLWTRTIWTYTDNTTETGYAVAYMGTNGNNGTNGLAGKDGTGIKTTTITYASSTSGTTAPSTGWTSSVPTIAAGSYLWTKTVWTYTDNTSETGYSVAMMGVKGDKGDPGIKGNDGTSGIIVSSVAPTSPQTGQLWQDTSTTPQLVKKWTGSEWVIWELYVENMNVNNLSALSPNLGNITGGSYTSWSVAMDPGGNPILNGIYLYNGRLRSVSITNPISTDPKKVGGIVNSRISGMEMFGGYTDYYQGEYAPVNGTAEDMIKELNGMSFWSQLNDTGAYIGRIVGFQLPDKDPYLLISAPRLLVNGDIHAGGGVTTGSTWIKLSSLASYKVEFGRVTISVSATTGNSTATINVGNIPKNKRPSTDLMFNVPGWSIDTNLDRRCQVNKSDGNVTILRPAANTIYQFEISYALP